MGDPEKRGRATDRPKPNRGVRNRGLLVPSPVRSLERLNQKPDRSCDPQLSDTLMMELITGSSTRGAMRTEDVMRLYADSFRPLPDDSGGRPFPTTYSNQGPGWERTRFPRCWLKKRQTISFLGEQLVRRFREAERARQFLELHRYLQFIDSTDLDAPLSARGALHGLFENSVSNNAIRQARRAHRAREALVRDAIIRIRLGFIGYAENPVVEGFAGSHPMQFGKYFCALQYYRRAILSLADGGNGDIFMEGHIPGVVEEARAAWRRNLEAAHRSAILPLPRETTSRWRGEIIRVLVDEMERQLLRVAWKVGFRFRLAGRDHTRAKIREMAEMI